MEQIKTNTLVIGGGPGGYTAAIRLGQLGVDVVIVERAELGGTCLNVGCIPSKALISASTRYYAAKNEWSKFGLEFNKIGLDWEKTMKWKDEVVNKNTSGVKMLLNTNKAKIVAGSCRLLSQNTAEVKNTKIEFENLIIATGSKIIELPSFKFDHKQILDSTDLLALTKLPKSLIILGGGIIGMEIGTIYQSLGVKVTIVEMLPNILPTYDKSASNVVKKSFEDIGGTILCEHKALSTKLSKDGVKLSVSVAGVEKEIEAELLAVAVGRVPNYDELNLAVLGVEMDGSRIKVNNQLQTNHSHIYAIGDVIAGPMLAHKASMEGVMAAEIIHGMKLSRSDVKVIPDIVYTKPEIAQVGISADGARSANRQIITGKFPFAALGMANATLETKGFVELVADADSKNLIGATIVSNHASELISEILLAIEMGATLEDIALAVHPHPTFSESIMEAAAAALGSAINIINRK